MRAKSRKLKIPEYLRETSHIWGKINHKRRDNIHIQCKVCGYRMYYISTSLWVSEDSVLDAKWNHTFLTKYPISNKYAKTCSEAKMEEALE